MKSAIVAFFRSYNLLFLSGMCLLFSVFTGCSDDEEDLPPAPISYTTLIYMAADNSMDDDVDYSIRQLKAGARHSAGTAVVYVDRLNEAPRLFKITQSGEEVMLKSYAEDNSAHIETLVEVIEETKRLVPSEKFGLILWSHSMGWMPIGHSPATRAAGCRDDLAFPRTRYIGPDQHPGDTRPGFSIEVDELAKALPDHVAEYIWFDVCLMGSVEALYEVRNKCNYLVASPAEVLAEGGHDASGIPFSKVLPFLFGSREELKQACQTYFNHYNGMSQEILRSSTITLVDAAELEGLYDVVQGMLKGHLNEVENMSNTESIQAYHTQKVPQAFFDLTDAMKHFKGAEDAALGAQMGRTVIFKACTDKIIKELSIDRSRFSGLSMYIPLTKWKGTTEYEYYFGSLKWAGVY